MLNADMDALGNDSVADLFVNNHADRSWVDVEDSASPSMVILVGHPFVYGSINYDVDDVADLVSCQCLGNMYGAVLLETLLEFISGLALQTVAVGHGRV